MDIDEACNHYAPMGMSITAIGKVLGIPKHKMLIEVRERGLRDLFNSRNYAPDCRPSGGKGWPRGVKRPYRVRVSGREILAELRRYPDTSTFTALSDIAASTVHRRFGSISLAHKFARQSSPSDMMWHYVAEMADKDA